MSRFRESIAIVFDEPHPIRIRIVNDPENAGIISPHSVLIIPNIVFVSVVRMPINFELQSLNRWLIANKLSLNIAKTEFMVIGSRQRLATFDDPELCVTVNNASVKQVKSGKTLGMTLDENLTWRDHVEVISKKISSGIGALKRIRELIDQETAIKAYQGFIEPPPTVLQYGMG